MIALSRYPEIADTDEFKSFCRQIFEYETNGTFGYCVDDQPRIISTAMFLSLYYLLPKESRSELDGFYDKTNAIEFIIDKFVDNNLQIEVMTDNNDDELWMKIAPWNHITIGATQTALSYAYIHGDLAENTRIKLKNHVNSIIEKNIEKIGSDKSFYNPLDLYISKDKRFTFPTAYFIWGLKMMGKAKL